MVLDIDETPLSQKMNNLSRKIQELESLLVAFSGGVDSTFLLATAQRVLGSKVVAATAVSETYPTRERALASEFAQQRGIEHIIFETEETKIPGFSANTSKRCYYCKMALGGKLIQIAKERGINHIAHAANMDDLKDYRPGLQGAKEMGFLAPLVDAGLTKDEIRLLAKQMGLPQWNKPAMACLASRFPYGTTITPEALSMVEAAENFLSDMGFPQCRVRYYGSLASLEVEMAEMDRLLRKENRESIISRLREIGFLHISVDLEGYVSGKMNRDLAQKRADVSPAN